MTSKCFFVSLREQTKVARGERRKRNTHGDTEQGGGGNVGIKGWVIFNTRQKKNAESPNYVCPQKRGGTKRGQGRKGQGEGGAVIREGRRGGVLRSRPGDPPLFPGLAPGTFSWEKKDGGG